MNIKLQAELTGEQASELLCAEILKETGLTLSPDKIKVEVTNKDGKWVDFDASRVRFSYTK